MTSERAERPPLLMASRNKGKLLELTRLLDEIPVDILTLGAFPELPETTEDGQTFFENAAKKAQEAARGSGILTIADDSGLEVDALGGLPGIHSARFAGEPADDTRNNKKLLKLLHDVPPEKRTARFVCVIAVATPGGEVYSAQGQCDGVILEEPRGCGGFGYDPLFYIPRLQKTFAELTVEEKNPLSHRGKALQEAVAIIRRLITGRALK